ncbi:MAG: hypothetical protein AAF614_26075 [Chloroflexota bacterium]
MTNFEAGKEFLVQQGLNLLAVFDTSQLPAHVTTPLLQSGVELENYSRLVLIGHGGRRLWDVLQQVGMPGDDPVDHFSWEQTAVFLHDYLHTTNYLQLYPLTTYPIPLGSLGELAGWSQPSPIGSGINPVYGLWFAYRAAVLVDLPLPLIQENYGERPCASCQTLDCVSACPGTAVSAPTNNQIIPIHFSACAQHRLRPQSSCATQCLARLACPIAPEHRYTTEQITYHYQLSRDSLKKYLVQK